MSAEPAARGSHALNDIANSRRIRVGIIGTGMVSHYHVRALKTLPNTSLTALCDWNLTRASAVQEAYRIPNVFPSVAAMARGGPLDVVHVSVPPPMHAATAIDCLNNGWHVFVEKPLALTVEECQAVDLAARRAGRWVGVNHNVTFIPAYLRLIRDVQARTLGRLEHVYVCSNLSLRQWISGRRDYWYLARPQNILFEVGPHPLSMIVRLLGPVKTARTLAADERILENGSRFFDSWQVALTCERGTAQWYLSLGRDFPNEWLCVEGQDGCATVDLLRNLYTVSSKTRWQNPFNDALTAWRRSQAYFIGGVQSTAKFIVRTIEGRGVSDTFSISMRDSVTAFYKAITRAVEPPVGIVEGTAVTEACRSIANSAGLDGG